jgi:hypothetical protein
MDWQNLLIWARGGQQASGKGVMTPLGCDQDGALLVSQGGKYAAATFAGRVFGVANQAAIAVTAAYAGTWTGLAVGNPAASGVNCKLINMSFSNTVVGVSVGSIGIMGGVSNIVPIVGTLNIQNMKLDGPSSRCTASAGQTINQAPIPTLLKLVGITGTGAVTTWRSGVVSCDLDGALIIPPGYFWATYCFMLATASLQFGFTWEETPVGNI